MKLKYRKRKKLYNKISLLLLIVVISIFISIIGIIKISERANEIIVPMAESRVKRIISMIVNNSTSEFTFDKELYYIDRDNSNNIRYISYNNYEINNLLNILRRNIDNSLEDIYNNSSYMNDYMLLDIPMGVLFNRTYLNNIGPKIRIKIDIIGNMISNIETEVKAYGINNAYIETRIYMEVEARVYLPFVTRNIKISNKYPIIMNIIQGNVPNGYITTYK